MTGHEQDKSPELRVHPLADGRVALTLPGQSPVVVGREEAMLRESIGLPAKR